ncbi:MAG: hypothetical protein KF861_14395 [Planctomycetaceae bacterium]|nr:hypothetical protein [Planctomycetaceae bacterium]
MAVRNSPSPKATPRRTDVDTPALVAAEETAPVQSTATGWRIGLPLVVLCLWMALLFTMVLLTSNPTTLNRAQILDAPLIVAATPASDDRVEWNVERSWPPANFDGAIRIVGLEGLSIDHRQAYLIPIERANADEFQLVRTPKPFAEALIYPATPEVIADLEAILRAAEAE